MRCIPLFLVLAIAASGCLEPMVSDEVPEGRDILPAGSVVPALESQPTLAWRIAENDFIDGDVVELRSAFRAGAPARYWDFGTSPTSTQPLYLLVRAADDGPLETPLGRFAPIGHPPVWNVAPGDAAYSPLWRVLLVPVTDAYRDEVLPSFDAVAQARDLGLLREPITTDVVINCPMVAPGVRLEQPDGSLAEPSIAYYQGVAVPYFDVGTISLGPEGRALVRNLYGLRREAGEPLSEPMRGVDMTGDDDLADSNDIFDSASDGERVTLFRRHSVVVPADYASIDTHADETLAGYTSVDDLFDAAGRARPEHVVASYPGEAVCNCPLAAP